MSVKLEMVGHERRIKWPGCGWEEGKVGEMARVLFWKECMDFEGSSLLYYLPFPPRLLGTNKLFNPKGVIIDKDLQGNDLKQRTLSIPKNRDFQNHLMLCRGSTSSSHRWENKPRERLVQDFPPPGPGSVHCCQTANTLPGMEWRGWVAPTPEVQRESLENRQSWPPMSS